ncbi:uncharacterized protein SPSK_10282 [Sporothrix schenckii 1099-18]|uniref:Uncharacterized protein n=1 Tax=Sporothrix schenckii 1099-18 TaxID=1397361 RepID=A0A0F2LTH4_SPOSC|nr:uncharacterized protein SPSK_10282 [Sporothrix schenckii 1099-18]KJR79825.1 hypothetical protein SPSK_10282 [Sporothrix schenckii 1099-18]
MCGRQECSIRDEEAFGMHPSCCAFAAHVNDSVMPLPSTPGRLPSHLPVEINTDITANGAASWFTISRIFVGITQYTFPISHADELHRAARIQHALARRLSDLAEPRSRGSDTWMRPLPMELWMMVAKHLTGECAFISALALADRVDDDLKLDVREVPQSRTLGEGHDMSPQEIWNKPFEEISKDGPAKDISEDTTGDTMKDASEGAPRDSTGTVQSELQSTAQLDAQLTFREGVARIDLDKPVYASFILYERRYYVHSLLRADPQLATPNSADRTMTKLCLLLFPGRLRTNASRVRLFVASDHLGVRCVRFFRQDDADDQNKITAWCRHQTQVLRHEVSWYCESLDLKAEESADGCPLTLKIQSDGIKLRTISISRDPAVLDAVAAVPVSEAQFLWPVPLVLAPQIGHIIPPRRPSPNERTATGPYRMSYVNINAPGTVGYSVACDGESIYSIIAHTRGEDSEALARAYNMESGLAYCSWVYMPLAPGETIVGIYRRLAYYEWPSPDPMSSLGLVFQTNYGRTQEFGAFWGNYLQRSNIWCLARLRNGHCCRMFFNRLDEHRVRLTIQLTAFDRGELGGLAYSPQVGAEEKRPPAMLKDEMLHRQSPLSIGPFRGPLPGGLYSSCSLENVASIRLCIEPTVPHRPVVGMLVSYADGRTPAYVGKWRVDWAAAVADELNPCMSRVDQSRSDGLHICHRRFQASRFPHWSKRTVGLYDGYYVAAVASCAPDNVSESERSRADFFDDDWFKDKWTTVPWRGVLEWWFSLRRTYLYHNGIELQGA